MIISSNESSGQFIHQNSQGNTIQIQTVPSDRFLAWPINHSLCLLFAVRRSPKIHIIYTLLPVMTWTAVLTQWQFFRRIIFLLATYNKGGLPVLNSLAQLIVGVELLVLSFFYRPTISVGLLLGGCWMHQVSRASAEKRRLWLLTSLLLSAFPLLPVVGKSRQTVLVWVRTIESLIDLPNFHSIDCLIDAFVTYRMDSLDWSIYWPIYRLVDGSTDWSIDIFLTDEIKDPFSYFTELSGWLPVCWDSELLLGLHKKYSRTSLKLVAVYSLFKLRCLVCPCCWCSLPAVVLMHRRRQEWWFTFSVGPCSVLYLNVPQKLCIL